MMGLQETRLDQQEYLALMYLEQEEFRQGGLVVLLRGHF